MSQQLYPSKKPCNKCGGLISWDVTLREYLKTKLPLNLDRTVHDSESCEKVKAEHPGLPTETLQTTTYSKGNSQSQYARPDRSSEIQKAHDENMQSNKELRETIDALAGKLVGVTDALSSIERTMLILSETISGYLDLPKEKRSGLD